MNLRMIKIHIMCSSLNEDTDNNDDDFLIMKMMATMLLIMIIILLAKSFKLQAPTPALVLPVLVKHEFVLRVCFGANVSLHRATLLRIVIKL